MTGSLAYGSTLLLGEQVLSNKHDDRSYFHEGTLSEQLPLPRSQAASCQGASTTVSAAQCLRLKMWRQLGEMRARHPSTYLFNHSAGSGCNHTVFHLHDQALKLYLPSLGPVSFAAGLDISSKYTLVPRMIGKKKVHLRTVLARP